MSKSETHSRIFETVNRIPRGRVATYGQIARLAGMPGHARLVGYALHALPEGSVVPWHRVVNRSGGISLPPGDLSHSLQRSLLESEGVVFDEADSRIDLSKYQWRR
jgi:methylated-DNA-protein-cysteine methyltransferase related protein